VASRRFYSGSAESSETLSARLLRGRLPVAAIFHLAHDIAVELRDLHQQSRGCGRLNASSVLVSGQSARLIPFETYWDASVAGRDVMAFGSLLYEMLTGSPLPMHLPASDMAALASRGNGRLRTAGMQLAFKCLAPKGQPLNMQQVATETRLLLLLLRQTENASPAGIQEEDRGVPLPAFSALPRHTPVLPNTLLPTAGDFGIGAKPPAVGAASGSPGSGPPQRQSRLRTARRLAPPPPPAPSQEPEEPAEPARPLPAPVSYSLKSFGKPGAAVEPEIDEDGGSCPKCDHPTVFVSRARSAFERTLERCGIPICRCHSCYHRFIVVAGIKIGKPLPPGNSRQPRRGSRPRR
jgi:hypothetical protein